MSERTQIMFDRRIIPFWQTAVDDHSKYNGLQAEHLHGDQGCCGVNISVMGDEASNEISLDVINIKEQTNKCSLSATECCCPFADPNNYNDLKEPCLGIHERDQANAKRLHRLWMINTTNKSLRAAWEQLKQRKSDGDKPVGEIKLTQNEYNLLKQCPSHFPPQMSNWPYTGNGICATANKTLLHTGGPNLSDLILTPLQERSKEESIFRPGKQQRVNLNGGINFGISYRQTMRRDLCLVRKKKMLHILLLQEDNETRQCMAKPVAKLKNKTEISSASISPHVPGEYLMMDSNGCLELHSFAHSLPTWRYSYVHKRGASPVIDEHWVCDFGSHPRALSYMDRTRLSTIDVRIPHPGSVTLFHYKNNLLFKYDDLYMFQQTLTNPFQYFVSSFYHFLIIDERYPNIPVQIWKHQLSKYPMLLSQGIYSDPATSQDNLLVLLACLKPQETCCFQVQPSSQQPVSLCPPWFCSAPRDPCTIFKANGISTPPAFERRSSYPVTGISSVPHSYGATIFQQTSIGDLFYQDFFYPSGMDEEKTHRCGLGYSPKNIDVIPERVQRWTEKIETEPTPTFPSFGWATDCSFIDALYEEKKSLVNCDLTVPIIEVNRGSEEEDDEESINTSSTIAHAKEKFGRIINGSPVNGDPSIKATQWVFHLTKVRNWDPFTERLKSVWNLPELYMETEKEPEIASEDSLEFDEPDEIGGTAVSELTQDVNGDDSGFQRTSPANISIFENSYPETTLDNNTELYKLLEKLGEEHLSQDVGANMNTQDCDIIPPSQTYESSQESCAVKKLSFNRKRKIYTSGF